MCETCQIAREVITQEIHLSPDSSSRARGSPSEYFKAIKQLNEAELELKQAELTLTDHQRTKAT